MLEEVKLSIFLTINETPYDSDDEFVLGASTPMHASSLLDLNAAHATFQKGVHHSIFTESKNTCFARNYSLPSYLSQNTRLAYLCSRFRSLRATGEGGHLLKHKNSILGIK